MILDGSASAGDGFAWSQISGDPLTITDADQAKSRIELGADAEPGTSYTLRITRLGQTVLHYTNLGDASVGRVTVGIPSLAP